MFPHSSRYRTDPLFRHVWDGMTFRDKLVLLGAMHQGLTQTRDCIARMSDDPNVDPANFKYVMQERDKYVRAVRDVMAQLMSSHCDDVVERLMYQANI